MPTFHNPSGNKAYIMNMYTRPEYRRQGIARKLLTILINDAKARGVSFITLEATKMGRPLYENAGFVSEGIHPGFYEDPKEDANIMWIRKN